MPQILLSRQAESDLDEIWDYLGSRNPQAALRLLGEINGMFELIAIPKVGREHDELDGSPRIFPVREYLIIYEIIEGAGVQILRVYHGARDRGRL